MLANSGGGDDSGDTTSPGSAEDQNKIPVRHSRVGEQYQATLERDGSTGGTTEEIVCEWDCDNISGDTLDDYMHSLQKVDPSITKETFSIEKSLSLLHQTNYDAKKALEIARSDPSRVIDKDMKWDNGDSNMFEYAYLHIGSDLNEIAKFLKPKTVAQVQRHYYHWKYGERYKRFLEKNYLISSSDEEKEEEEEEEEEEEKVKEKEVNINTKEISTNTNTNNNDNDKDEMHDNNAEMITQPPLKRIKN